MTTDNWVYVGGKAGVGACVEVAVGARVLAETGAGKCCSNGTDTCTDVAKRMKHLFSSSLASSFLSHSNAYPTYHRQSHQCYLE